MERTEHRRADARRNVAAILDAAQECLTRDPEASVADIAQAAGVGRVTLYGHFKNRAELVDAVFGWVNEESGRLLADVDTTGEPVAALTRLVTATWPVVHRFRSLLVAAQQELPAERIRAHHDQHFRQLDGLLRRGRRSGAFRSDVPRHWLATVYYSTVHAAANEAAAGRLTEKQAGRLIVATLVAAFTPPGAVVPA